ncbi:hypothetical protein BBJ28_00026655 [Nothophytophthora sp. Chile5]|nr:hypothetical protein BBJ28_00026655 [Nothophytophthora sp. Chile5]
MTAARLVYVLSPAKTLDLSAPRVLQCSHPSLLSDAHELIAQLRSLSKSQSKKVRLLVDVASQEYFRSLPRDALEAANVNVVDCVFQDDGEIKSVYAKRARGLMYRYLIQQRVDSLERITRFDLEGYKYSSIASNNDTLVFTRTAAAQKAALRQTQEKAKAKKASKSSLCQVECE